jgi:lysophospholipase L1-like esterase
MTSGDGYGSYTHLMPLQEHQETSMKSTTILCIGDSHTAGFPDYDPLMGGDPESSYQFWLREGLLAELPDHEFRLINEGVCGDTSRGIAARLFRALASQRCDLTILAGGTNDLGMISEEQIMKHLTEGYDACRSRGIPVIAPTIPPISLQGYGVPIKKINLAIERYTSAASGIFLADWFGALKDEDAFLADRFDAGDGVHLSVEGYKRIGTLMVPLVRQAIISH